MRQGFTAPDFSNYYIFHDETDKLVVFYAYELEQYFKKHPLVNKNKEDAVLELTLEDYIDLSYQFLHSKYNDVGRNLDDCYDNFLYEKGFRKLYYLGDIYEREEEEEDDV